MSMTTLTGLFAIALYLLTLIFLHQERKIRSPRAGSDHRVLFTGLAAVVAHSISAWGVIISEGGYLFGIPQVSTLIFAAISLLLLISSVRKPLHNLMLGLFPLAALSVLASLLITTRYPAQQLGSGVAAHVLLSILAYSFFTIAALQAAFLAFQNYQLRHRHAASVIRRFPPLQDMEVFLFELLWTGQILLTLSIFSGFLFVDDMWTQGLPHKTFFSLLAWLVFAILLGGRHLLGWRGNTAIKGTLIGFGFLILGFYGSKFVLEYLL